MPPRIYPHRHNPRTQSKICTFSFLRRICTSSHVRSSAKLLLRRSARLWVPACDLGDPPQPSRLRRVGFPNLAGRSRAVPAQVWRIARGSGDCWVHGACRLFSRSDLDCGVLAPKRRQARSAVWLCGGWEEPCRIFLIGKVVNG